MTKWEKMRAVFSSKPFKIFSGIVGLLFLSAAIIAAIPPLNNRFAFIAQSYYLHFSFYRLRGLDIKGERYTTIRYFSFFRDHGNYTGKFKVWRRDGFLLAEEAYKNGKRDGKWKTWDNAPFNGSYIENEFRDGEPWNGWCFWWEGKGWMTEYREGKPWNGWLPALDKDGKPSTVWYIDGQEVSEGVYVENIKRWQAQHPEVWTKWGLTPPKDSRE